MQDVLALVTHELASPLVVIEGFADALTTDGSYLKPEDVKALEAITRAARQIQDVLDSISDARHVEAGTLDLRLERVDLGHLIEDTAKDLASKIEPRPLTIDADLGIVVEADDERIRQVLSHLLVNAAKFSPPEQPVSITTRARRDAVEISVTDRCAGIPPEAKGRLFGRFSRVQKSVGGLGLGLFVSRGIARAHNGDLTYEALAEGGCRFVLRLPR